MRAGPSWASVRLFASRIFYEAIMQFDLLHCKQANKSVFHHDKTDYFTRFIRFKGHDRHWTLELI